jgi:hypothetical protein
MASRSNLPAGARVLTIEGDDSTRGNAVRLVDVDGYIYVEASGRHDGQTVYTLIRINRDRLVPGLLGWFL